MTSNFSSCSSWYRIYLSIWIHFAGHKIFNQPNNSGFPGSTLSHKCHCFSCFNFETQAWEDHLVRPCWVRKEYILQFNLPLISFINFNFFKIFRFNFTTPIQNCKYFLMASPPLAKSEVMLPVSAMFLPVLINIKNAWT